MEYYPIKSIKYLLSLLAIPLLVSAGETHALSIEESIHIALENNPSIKIAETKVADGRQSVAQAIGAALPAVNMQGSKIVDEVVRPIDNFLYVPGVVPDPADPITFLMANPTLEFDMTRTYQMDLSVTQPLFTGGKIALGTIMARQGLNLLRSQHEQEMNNLAYNVIQAYMGLLVTKEFLAVAEDGYNTAREFFEISELLYNQGMISKLDLLQAEVQAANLLPQKIKAENGVTMAEAGLRILLDMDEDTELVLLDSMRYTPIEYDLDDLRARALLSRAELQQMEISKSLSSLNVNMARSDFLPSVALSWSYSKFGDEFDTFSDWDESNMLALGFSYNLFSGGARWSKVQQAKIARKQVDYGYDALKDAIMLDVEQNYLALVEAQNNIKSQQKTVMQAEEAARLAKIQYREGAITNLQANQVQISLTAAKANYLQALFSYTLAEAGIKRAVGESLYH
ncbi:MAG: TolC family protein [Candidatus Marinimicrobia bacterium]|nr:TolC family protein [Candidatus Neomarinimicrobiota bacterium]MCF7904072.1 TolC family protein [Candidatus Neomarinimicrobiota bacterium]